ncbi:hypothetical protein [Nocardioides panacisoli]|uniref:DUF1109 domain-containing protein n=1 Tax=Nocardioides panacisoli TaxID=627624 RepID=A0ABP7IPG4_9ACTN
MSDELDLEREIARILAGDADPETDPVLLWLASATRSTPSARLTARVDAALAAPARRATVAGERPSRWVAVVAIALAAAFVTQGLGSILAGRWVARGLGESFAPDAALELGLAMIAVGMCTAAAAISRVWGPVAVLTGTSLATALAVHGVREFGEFAAGAALHATEGLLGVALLAAWLVDLHGRRRGPAPVTRPQRR